MGGRTDQGNCRGRKGAFRRGRDGLIERDCRGEQKRELDKGRLRRGGFSRMSGTRHGRGEYTGKRAEFLSINQLAHSGRELASEQGGKPTSGGLGGSKKKCNGGVRGRRANSSDRSRGTWRAKNRTHCRDIRRKRGVLGHGFCPARRRGQEWPIHFWYVSGLRVRASARVIAAGMGGQVVRGRGGEGVTGKIQRAD